MKVTTAPCASALKVMTQKPSVTMRRGMTSNLAVCTRLGQLCLPNLTVEMA